MRKKLYNDDVSVCIQDLAIQSRGSMVIQITNIIIIIISIISIIAFSIAALDCEQQTSIVLM